MDPGEEVLPERWRHRCRYTQELMKKLARDGDTTRADREESSRRGEAPDGVTTAEELDRAVSHSLREWLRSDSDFDGVYGEDGADHAVINGTVYHLRIDNDGDGLVDEDPPSAIEFLPVGYKPSVVFSFSYPLISKTVVNDTTVYLAVIIYNRGNETETFHVSAYYDENLIENITVTGLTPGSYYVISFRWNTTTAPLGKYLITFRITPDNICAARGVNIADISVIALNFGLTYEDPWMIISNHI